MTKNIIFILVALALFSCEDLLEKQDPTQVSKEQALAGNGIEGVAITMYNSIQGTGYYGARAMVVGDVLADNIRATFASNRYASEFDVSPGVGALGYLYGPIANANVMIAEVDGTEAPEARKRQLKGEAQFIRGLVYHDLVRNYAYEPGQEVNGWDAGVILRTEPVEGADQADFRSRATNVEIYQQVETDLLDAITNMDNSAYPTRASQASAQALLSRVYLYWGRYNEAITQATAALNSGTATLVDTAGYADAFHGTLNPEAFFELVYDPIQENVGLNNALFSVCTSPEDAAGAWGDLVFSESLLGVFTDTNDVRLQVTYVDDAGNRRSTKWTGSSGANNVAPSEAPSLSNTWSDNIEVIRYSEVLLIRAEAYAETNQLGLALADLNELRENRGVAALSIDNQADMVAAIMEERRRELCFEGHRWFDLKRKGMTIPKSEAAITSVPYTDFRILAPLPQNEVFLNDNLMQNPGY